MKNKTHNIDPSTFDDRNIIHGKFSQKIRKKWEISPVERVHSSSVKGRKTYSRSENKRMEKNNTLD